MIMKERKIVELKGIPGFMDLNLDLTDTFDKYEAQTCKEAEDMQKYKTDLKDFIDLEYNKWCKNYSMRKMPYQNALEFTQTLLKAIIRTK